MTLVCFENLYLKGMSVNSPLETSRLLLLALSTRVFPYYEDPIPPLRASLLVVSNHRSFIPAVIFKTPTVLKVIRFELGR